jgi:hypothetical protein
MSRADYYFMTNLHLMCDKSTLKQLSGIEGASLKSAYQQKSLKDTDDEKEETSRIDSIMEMLENLFHSFSGGGMNIEKLKDILRKNVKNIKPR